MDWIWLPLAVALASASIATFACMQRHLFRAGGRTATLRSVTATALAGNAISVSVPVAGPQLGTAFAFRRFRRLGIDPALAGWTLIVSGVVSSLAAGVVVVTGALLSGNDAVAITGITGAIIGVCVLAVATLALRHPAFRRVLERWLAWILARVQGVLHRHGGNPRDAITGFVGRLGGLGLANWLTDAGILVVSILAVGGSVPWRGVLLAYAVRIAAGGISITPGGLGVVEAALAVALMGVGLQHLTAVAAALLYRFISFWALAGVGWIVYFLSRRSSTARSFALSRRRSWATV
jgi:uncharacterized protein (TIRG00374 family)